MKKNMVIFALIVTLVVSMAFGGAFLAHAAVPTYNVNTFNVYSSSTKRALTSNNRGIRMLAKVPDGRCGLIYCYRNVRARLNDEISWTMTSGNYYWYYIPKMGNNCVIKLYIYSPKTLDGGLVGPNPGSGLFAEGRIHMSSRGNKFGNIIKIDCLKGGYYFKYN